ncbi:hypothetical protein MMC16_004468 [Acarospora aff. strigata]|nr:hypothetical protein [Acarospora aff. strigata]
MRAPNICLLLLPILAGCQNAVPAAAPAIESPAPSSTPGPIRPSSTFDTVPRLQPTILPSRHLAEPSLDPREIAAAGPPVVLPTQVSPVTQIYVDTVLPNGKATQVLTIYSQAFSKVPDQGPTPVPGQIGLGTQTGSIGVVKTARSGAERRVSARWGVVGMTAILAAVMF